LEKGNASLGTIRKTPNALRVLPLIGATKTNNNTGTTVPIITSAFLIPWMPKKDETMTATTRSRKEIRKRAVREPRLVKGSSL
jgi:hypothetical protein